MARTPEQEQEQDQWDLWNQRLQDGATWVAALGIALWETAGEARIQVYGLVATLLGVPAARAIDRKRKQRQDGGKS